MTDRISFLRGHQRAGISLSIACMLALPTAARAQVMRSGSGTGTSAAQAALDLFRTDLGGGTAAGANGSFGGVRREINWDGVPAGSATPNNLPGNFFNATSPRGVVLSTPGTGVQVSSAVADPGAAAANFGNINATYSSVFTPFSAQRLFTPIGSNITDVTFFVAGTNTAGLTRGFGSIFNDVDLANISSIQFFDAANLLLGSYFVPNVAGGTPGNFSFLGVSFATPVVSRVRITTGNVALSSSALDVDGSDLVVMDDFVYAEVVQVVPEPATLGLVAFGLVAVAFRLRRRAA